MQEIIAGVFDRGVLDRETEQLLEASIIQAQLTTEDIEAIERLMMALFSRSIRWKYSDKALGRGLRRSREPS
ncbi:MAG: hypothetical protein AB4040_04645 [Synechococcus sp.]